MTEVFVAYGQVFTVTDTFLSHLFHFPVLLLAVSLLNRVSLSFTVFL